MYAETPWPGPRIYGTTCGVLCVITVLNREVAENCTLLGYCAASSGKFLAKFRGQPIGPILRRTLRMGPISYPETTVRNYHCPMRNNPNERSSRLCVLQTYTIKTWYQHFRFRTVLVGCCFPKFFLNVWKHLPSTQRHFPETLDRQTELHCDFHSASNTERR